MLWARCKNARLLPVEASMPADTVSQRPALSPRLRERRPEDRQIVPAPVPARPRSRRIDENVSNQVTRLLAWLFCVRTAHTSRTGLARFLRVPRIGVARLPSCAAPARSSRLCTNEFIVTLHSRCRRSCSSWRRRPPNLQRQSFRSAIWRLRRGVSPSPAHRKTKEISTASAQIPPFFFASSAASCQSRLPRYISDILLFVRSVLLRAILAECLCTLTRLNTAPRRSQRPCKL
jgi:hypothetical protein